MMVTPETTSGVMEQLIAILDEQIEMLGHKYGHLEALSAALLARNESAMEQLLDEMEAAQQAQALADVRLGAIRAALARALGVGPAGLKLAVVIPMLSPTWAQAVSKRRQEILQLSEAVRRQHLATAVVLQESARVNRLILQALVGGQETVTTYGQGGAESWRCDNGLLDAQR